VLEALELGDSVGAAEVGLEQFAGRVAVCLLACEALAEMSRDSFDVLALDSQAVVVIEELELLAEVEVALQTLDLFVGQQTESGVGFIVGNLADDFLGEQQRVPEGLVEHLGDDQAEALDVDLGSELGELAEG
jgi:hypothetical protein